MTRAFEYSGLAMLLIACSTTLRAEETEDPFESSPKPAAVSAPATQVVRERLPNSSIQVEKHAYKGPKGEWISHGAWIASYADGRKLGGGMFVNGQRDGKWTRWHAVGDGELFSQPMYTEYQGPFLSEATFANGLLEGDWVIYDGKQRVISRWAFRQGKQHGPWTWWYANGQKRREAGYHIGELHGQVREWDTSGKVTLSEDYVAGRKSVQDVWWYRPQSKEVQGRSLQPYQKLVTTYDWWAGSASTVPQGTLGKKIKHGEWTWWYPSGKTRVVGEYWQDERAGIWTWFDESGKVTKVTQFSPVDRPAAEQPGENIVRSPAAAPARPRVASPPPAKAPTDPVPAVASPSTKVAAPAPAKGPAPSEVADKPPAKASALDLLFADEGPATLPKAGAVKKPVAKPSVAPDSSDPDASLLDASEDDPPKSAAKPAKKPANDEATLDVTEDDIEAPPASGKKPKPEAPAPVADE